SRMIISACKSSTCLLALVASGAVAACSSSAVGGGGGVGASGEPVPVVSDVTPPSGDYGATITVHGTNVLRQAVGVYARAPEGDRIDPVTTPNQTANVYDPRTGRTGAPSDDASLTFRFPSPAEGAMTLYGPDGEIAAGSFSPSYTPGRALTLSGE